MCRVGRRQVAVEGTLREGTEPASGQAGVSEGRNKVEVGWSPQVKKGAWGCGGGGGEGQDLMSAVKGHVSRSMDRRGGGV